MDMNPVSISITGIFVILGVAFTTLLLVAILGNLKTARRYRQSIGDRLSGLRLSRMLMHKGIDQDTYLHTQPVLDIEQQMKRCADCDATERCDVELAASNNDEQIAEFCVNDSELKAIRRKLESAA
jgi:hypothetical protein